MLIICLGDIMGPHKFQRKWYVVMASTGQDSYWMPISEFRFYMDRQKGYSLQFFYNQHGMKIVG